MTVPGTRRGPADIDVHRSRHLTADDVTVHQGIPVTSVARTIVDLAEVLGDEALRRAVHEAEIARLLDAKAILATAARLSGRHHITRLARLLDEPLPPTSSMLEQRFLRLCAEAGVPAPAVNTMVEGYEVDFVWRDQKLIVETDGGAVHQTRRNFESDRVRDADLTLKGFRTIRITWRRQRDEPEQVKAIVSAALR